MLKSRRRLCVAALGALLAAAPAATLLAQTHTTQNSTVVGPPQLRDFQLKGERRTPPPQTQPQPVPASPSPTTERPVPTQTAPQPRARPAAPSGGERTPARAAPQPDTGVPTQPQDVFQLPSGQPETSPAPAPATPAPATAPESGGFPWLYAVPLALLALGGLALLRRKRKSGEAPAAAALPPEAAPKPPRPEPVPRPWLELDFKAERAASTPTEAVVEFEMVIRNSGKSPARNIRLNARMFNAGREQDKEIGAFFKSKGEGRPTHGIPELPPGESGLIQGTVTMPREEMRALKVNEQLLFVPMVAINVMYDWGTGRSGQTSKSYVIGRELGQESDKMGAFRLDLGPRIYRTVGQRAHSLAKRA